MNEKSPSRGSARTLAVAVDSQGFVWLMGADSNLRWLERTRLAVAHTHISGLAPEIGRRIANPPQIDNLPHNRGCWSRIMNSSPAEVGVDPRLVPKRRL